MDIFWISDCNKSEAYAIRRQCHAITLLHSAYLSEIYGSAILAVSDGQTEAARSLGLGRISIFFDVIFPQAMRSALPQLVSQFAMIIKDSSWSR